jgi:hypothetical protein
MNETPTKPRAKAGSGMLYQRGSTWWIRYHQDGRPFYESTGTKESVGHGTFYATVCRKPSQARP